MELAPADGEGLDDEARQAFADMITRINNLIQDALSEGAERGEFGGAPDIAALHITTVARGLAVMERAFGDEALLRKIAGHTIDLVLSKGRPPGKVALILRYVQSEQLQLQCRMTSAVPGGSRSSGGKSRIV